MNASGVSPFLSANQRPVSPELLDLRRLAAAILLRSLQGLALRGLEQEQSYKWFFTKEHERDFKMWCLLAGISPTRARQKAQELMKTGQQRPKGLSLRGKTWFLTVYRGGSRYRVKLGRSLSREAVEELAAVKRAEFQRLFQVSVSQQEPGHEDYAHETTAAYNCESPKEIIPLSLIEGPPTLLT